MLPCLNLSCYEFLGIEFKTREKGLSSLVIATRGSGIQTIQTLDSSASSSYHFTNSSIYSG